MLQFLVKVYPKSAEVSIIESEVDMKHIIESHLKAWFKVTFFMWVAYLIYDYMRYSMTGISDPLAVQIGTFGGTMFSTIFIWGILPLAIFRLVRKIYRKIKMTFRRAIVSAAEQF